jgi:tetratricopeptide (TPR) repeat protein
MARALAVLPLDPPEHDLLLSQPDVSPGKSPSKQRRAAAARPSSKAVPNSKAVSKKTRPASARPARAVKPSPKPAARPLSKAATKAPSKPARKPSAKLAVKPAAKLAAKPLAKRALRAVAAPPVPAPAAPPPKKPSFYEAIAIYESGVRGLQRHDYPAAAESFRQVLQRYPEERELIERARLYLRVCERETAQRPAGPQTTSERVYAATMSLSAGDSEAALGHVQRALDQEPASHHAHYMMAVIRSTRFETAKAVEHLRRAIELNPDSRSLARQDADLERLRQFPTVKTLLEEAPGDPRGRSRGRR